MLTQKIRVPQNGWFIINGSKIIFKMGWFGGVNSHIFGKQPYTEHILPEIQQLTIDRRFTY